MDGNKAALRIYREARNRFYHWVQKWMSVGLNERDEEQCGPVDVRHIVHLLSSGLGFRVRRVDQDPAPAPAGGHQGSCCRTVVSCSTSGLRAVLELPQDSCVCIHANNPESGFFWDITSSSESLHEAGSSSLPELNTGLSTVVREVVGKLHQIITELNIPDALHKEAHRLTTGSLQSLSLSPSMETMRRVSSSPILKDTSVFGSEAGTNAHKEHKTSAQPLQEFSSIASTDISPIHGAAIRSASFQTSSPRSAQLLEKLSQNQETKLIDKLEDIYKELGNAIALVKGHGSTVSTRTLKKQTAQLKATAGSLKKTPAVTRKLSSPVTKLTHTKTPSTPGPPLRVKKSTLTPASQASTVKKFFSGSKLQKTSQTETASISEKSPVTTKRIITSKPAEQKAEMNLRSGQKKPPNN